MAMVFRAALAALCFVFGAALWAADTPHRVTILYDAFGNRPGVEKDWGYSALVEYGGRRILFDTGNNAAIFARNAAVLGADLSTLDFAVISHRHLDHTAGLSHLLERNPALTIYVPKESFGVFGSALPPSFYRSEPSLPDEMRYFDGHPPQTLRFGTAWPGAKFEAVERTGEIAPGVYLISLVSETPGTRELRELSLAVRTSEGLALMVGCSHPGIERIVEGAAAIDSRIAIIFGGFHLPAAPDAEIERLALALRERFAVSRLAPGHCTGEPAFAAFRKRWESAYSYAGVGTVIELPR
jgi:7,8-dihydropterin-6-yl-methyl-4-(beta-D-ribofuranosyl)aminobenzene 5'-phosphate synthase